MPEKVPEPKKRVAEKPERCLRCGEKTLVVTTYHTSHRLYGDYDLTQSRCETCGYIEID